MKNILKILLAVMAICLSSCEKHDGVYYASNICEVEVDGIHYIEQARLGDDILGPGSTPDIRIQSNLGFDSEGMPAPRVEWYSFRANCSRKRGGAVELSIGANIFDFERIDVEGQTIEFRLDKTKEDLDYKKYTDYCIANRINYAIIGFPMEEIGVFIDNGTLTVTKVYTDDNSRPRYFGSFQFSYDKDGKVHTAKGEFKNLPLRR